MTNDDDFVYEEDDVLYENEDFTIVNFKDEYRIIPFNSVISVSPSGCIGSVKKEFDFKKLIKNGQRKIIKQRLIAYNHGETVNPVQFGNYVLIFDGMWSKDCYSKSLNIPKEAITDVSMSKGYGDHLTMIIDLDKC